MPQPIQSKQELVNRLFSLDKRGGRSRIDLVRDLAATNTALWTDAGGHVEERAAGPTRHPRVPVQTEQRPPKY